jgi:hypothetical protein
MTLARIVGRLSDFLEVVIGVDVLMSALIAMETPPSQSRTAGSSSKTTVRNRCV